MLEELGSEDIIERVPEDQPTPWVSPIVAVPKKDGGVRICVDMRLANEATSPDPYRRGYQLRVKPCKIIFQARSFAGVSSTRAGRGKSVHNF